MSFGVISGLGPKVSVLRGVTIFEGERAILGKHVLDKPNTHINCELDWSIMQRRAHDKGRRLTASVGRVYYRPRRGWDCTPRAKSDIYDCLVAFVCAYFSQNKI